VSTGHTITAAGGKAASDPRDFYPACSLRCMGYDLNDLRAKAVTMSANLREHLSEDIARSKR
jgi:endogenous inhibitor of DNA gyrase (YacG/DUF329 family)